MLSKQRISANTSYSIHQFFENIKNYAQEYFPEEVRYLNKGSIRRYSGSNYLNVPKIGETHYLHSKMERFDISRILDKLR